MVPTSEESGNPDKPGHSKLQAARWAVAKISFYDLDSCLVRKNLRTCKSLCNFAIAS